MATELNFFGHNRWTWPDRPTDFREGVRRFCRFHATNGAISLAGGTFVMPALMEIGEMHYLLANALTVGVCAAANIIAADRVVYTRVCSVMLAWAVAWSAPVEAAELGAETLAAFDRYVRVTESRMDAELRGQAPSLAVDRLEDLARQKAYSRLKRGDIVVGRLVARDAGHTIKSPRGLGHHWTGTTSVPGATVERTVDLMQGHDRYQEIYAPNVRRSRTIDRQRSSASSSTPSMTCGIDVVEPGDSRRPWMDRRPVRDEHPQGVARVHAEQHADGTDKGPMIDGRRPYRPRAILCG